VPDETLKKFPRTKIFIASNDPLRDESFKFHLRLLQLGVDSEMKEYKLMPHGFLNFNFPGFGLREEALEGIRVA
jgi:hormone-sensitive lipase